MKKIISLSLLVLIVAVSLGSCKSHERCPAYGKVEQSAKKSL